MGIVAIKATLSFHHFHAIHFADVRLQLPLLVGDATVRRQPQPLGAWSIRGDSLQ